ncbi:MAG TPA: hypothetical protein VJG90_07905 [Candidatus Nanoarchaeia archaeon]|nr:hypothetical protein [Candidatus Nanoarchaeia archaeon]
MPLPSTPAFDLTGYLQKIEEKTFQIEEDSQTMQEAIEQRDTQLIRITLSLQKDLHAIQIRLDGYKKQLELTKKDLLAVLKNYKLATRKDEFEKLQIRIENLGFENNITRAEFQKLIGARSSKH